MKQYSRVSEFTAQIVWSSGWEGSCYFNPLLRAHTASSGKIDCKPGWAIPHPNGFTSVMEITALVSHVMNHPQLGHSPPEVLEETSLLPRFQDQESGRSLEVRYGFKQTFYLV